MKKIGILLAAFVFANTLLAVWSVPSWALAGALGAPQSKAVQWLAAQLEEQDGSLWVYKDLGDGLNRFTQKAWMGDTFGSVPEMNEAAEGRGGTTGIAAELDFAAHSWGGYMFVNGILKPGEQQPEADFGDADAGMDLSGAQRLSFYARGENGGESVEFFAAGLGWYFDIPQKPYMDSVHKLSLGTVKLTQEWQRFEIPLQGSDLSRIGCGFGWVTNWKDNYPLGEIKFYLDDIKYEWAERAPGPIFIKSYESLVPDMEGAVINDFAYLYDNAAAAIALSRSGNIARAQQLGDAMVYAYQHDRTFSDGRLRNAYASGDPASFPGWLSAKGEPFARMPGFYDLNAKAWHEDVYAVSTSTGNLAWAVLALCELYEQAPQQTQFLDAANGIGQLILSLKDEKGGYAGGFEGWDEGSAQVTYKSTEHNIDLIPAFAKLARLSGDSRYADASAYARAFVLSMYDGDRGCFYTGTLADGITPNTDVLPLDCNTWAILALGDSFQDGEKVMAFVEANMAVGGGYDFNTDRDGIWFEGTAQVALAYKQLGNEEKYQQILSFLNASAREDGSITAADRDGVTTGFDVGGTDIPWLYGKRVHTGATAWLAFAQLGVNPFE